MPVGQRSLTLTRRSEPTSSGDLVFRHPDVRASVYITKRMFTRGSLPNTITLTTSEDVIRLPGNLDPELTAKRIAFLETREQRNRARAEEELGKADALARKARTLHDSIDRLSLDS
jgi:hypothetical protein